MDFGGKANSDFDLLFYEHLAPVLGVTKCGDSTQIAKIFPLFINLRWIVNVQL